MPSIAIVRAGLVAGPVERPRQRRVQDVVDERRLAGAADAGDRGQHAERNRHVDVLQVVRARAADDELALAVAGPAARRASESTRAPVRYAPGQRRRVPSLDQLPRGVPWKITWPPCSPAPGPRSIDVVGRPDRLLVVLDDDDGVAEIAQPRQRRQQLAVVALMQADRRLVEHVEHAGQVRADLRREPDALPFAARQRRRAAAERQVADADVVQEPQPLLNLAQDRSAMSALAIGQLRARRTPAAPRRSAGSTYSAIVRPLTRTDRLCAFSRSPLAGRARPQRPVRLELLLLGPAALLVAAAQVRQEPFEPGAERSRGFAVGSSRARSGHRTAAARAASSAACANGTSRSMPKSRLSACSASRTSLRSPLRPRRDGAVGERLATRPARRARGSKSTIAPSPWHSGQAPCGELNENARGVISGMLRPQSTHASRRENSRSPPSNVLMTTMSSARLSATSTDSVSRRSIAAADDQRDRRRLRSCGCAADRA